VGQALKGKAREDRSKTKAPLKVLAYTGLPAAQLMALEPQHIDWEAECMRVAPKRKGRGTDRRTLPLSTQAVEALREFDALDCWGRFSTSSMWKTFNRACVTAKVQGVRPYDLRHSFGTKVYATTGDPLAVQSLLLHSTQKMTARYTQGAMDHRLRLAVRSFGQAVRPANRGSKSWQSAEKVENTA
jgi:integrase